MLDRLELNHECEMRSIGEDVICVCVYSVMVKCYMNYVKYHLDMNDESNCGYEMVQWLNSVELKLTLKYLNAYVIYVSKGKTIVNYR